MRTVSVTLAGVMGVMTGVLATLFYLGPPRMAVAASNDRHGDFAMATGAVSINPRVQTDGVWLLDYRTGKLLGTVIDKSLGKIIGWAEVDLTGEFEVKPLQEVHFLMTTGYITQGQSALYVAETTTGRFGVYTMGPGPNGNGMSIRRHDMTSFRQVMQAGPVPGPQLAPGAMAPGANPAAANLPNLPNFPGSGGQNPNPGAPAVPAAPAAAPPSAPAAPATTGKPTVPAITPTVIK